MVFLIAQGTALLALIIYCFFTLMYQFIAVWILAPVVAIGSLIYLNRAATKRAFGLAEAASILGLPMLLSVGLAIRIGGPTSAANLKLIAIFLFVGIAIMTANYLALRMGSNGDDTGDR